MRWSAFDDLITAATTDESEVRRAREEWAALSGNVHVEHELYAERSDAFVEWFVLERPGADGRTQVLRYLSSSVGRGLPAEDRALVEGLSRSHRSLFQVRRMRTGGLVVDDRLGGGCFDVDERRRLPGVAVGDLFEARIVPDLESPFRVAMLRALLFHPREAGREIVQLAKAARRAGEAREEVLFRLQRLRLRCIAYRHVPAARIYAQGEAGT